MVEPIFGKEILVESIKRKGVAQTKTPLSEFNDIKAFADLDVMKNVELVKELPIVGMDWLDIYDDTRTCYLRITYLGNSIAVAEPKEAGYYAFYAAVKKITSLSNADDKGYYAVDYFAVWHDKENLATAAPLKKKSEMKQAVFPKYRNKRLATLDTDSREGDTSVMLYRIGQFSDSEQTYWSYVRGEYQFADGFTDEVRLVQLPKGLYAKFGTNSQVGVFTKHNVPAKLLTMKDGRPAFKLPEQVCKRVLVVTE